MKKFKLFLLATLFCAVSAQVSAASVVQDNRPWSFLQIGIVPNAVALVPSDIPVMGINAELFCGFQERVGILNLQPIYGETQVLKGLSVQGVGLNDETIGLQIGLVSFQNYFCGVNLGVVTGARENHGLQIGLVNLSGDSAPAMYDKDTEVTAARGVQFGLVNSTTNGFQFGLLNYNAESKIPWMVLFNYSAR